MSFENIPYHLRYSIEEIISNARKHITVHYLHNIAHSAGKPATRGSIGCQIVDNHDYSTYFYEPRRFATLEARTIRCTDQRSAHQNAIIALKKWEDETREFLAHPPKPALERNKKKVLSVGRIEQSGEKESTRQRSSQWQRNQSEKLFQTVPNSLLV